jgi:hypothetical protein
VSRASAKSHVSDDNRMARGRLGAERAHFSHEFDALRTRMLGSKLRDQIGVEDAVHATMVRRADGRCKGAPRRDRRERSRVAG